MEYRDHSSFERLTGRGYFTPSGQTGSIDLGNILILRLDHGQKLRDIYTSFRGLVVPRARKVIQRVPLYSIEGDQFATPLLPLLLAGTAGDPWVQTEDSGLEWEFVAQPGLAWFIGGGAGLFNLTVSAVERGATLLVEGSDYEIDLWNGIISIPVEGSAVEAGDTVTVSYSTPPLVLEQYTALDTLSREGALVVIAEDEYGPPAMERWEMEVTLTLKAQPDTAPDKFRRWSMEALLYGTPRVLRRHEDKAGEQLIDEWLLDNDDIILWT